MAIAWYSSAGQPSDSVGVAGDLNFDTVGRIIWVKQSNNSWAGGAYSNIGPTGPAQLSGTGSPSNNIGQIGNGYCDLAAGLTYLKGANGWAQVGTLNAINQFSPILQGAGPPNSSTAPTVAVGQFYFDTTNNLMYGPSTSASYTGLTSVFNMVGPTGAAGPTTAYRQSVRGEWWRSGTQTAGTYYPVCVVLCAADQSASPYAYNITLAEPMYAGGFLNAVTVFNNSTIAATLSLQVLKNGTVVYTATSLITIGANQTTATRVLPSGLTFAANDVITMNVASSVGTANQHLFVNLFYTTNS